jgi:hypothetical protein
LRIHGLLIAAMACGAALVGTDALAQGRNPRSGPNPAFGVPSAGLSAAQLTFSTGAGGLNPIGNPVFPDLISGDSLEIVDAHNWARQQTLLCLMYLRANREAILAGTDPLYNSTFGAYYDRTNQFVGTYTIDESHYNQVVSTFSTMRFLLEQPTFYDYGTSNATGFGTVFGYDRGLRQWGYSTSASRDHYDDIFLTNNQAPAFPPRRWDNDDAPFRFNGQNDTLPQRIANSVDRPFFFEKLDIYGNADDPNTQNLGGIFFYNPNSTDRQRTLGERQTIDPTTGQLLDSPYANGDLEFNVDRFGRIFADFNFVGIDGETFSRYNSGEAFLVSDLDGDGFPDLDANGNPILVFNTEPASSFAPPSLRQFQMIMMSFSEFTTVLGDSRGGAFVGLSGVLRVLDPTGRASLFGEALESRNFAAFSDLLNARGIVDPRVFPPAGKNGQSFNPAIPSS